MFSCFKKEKKADCLGKWIDRSKERENRRREKGKRQGADKLHILTRHPPNTHSHTHIKKTVDDLNINLPVMSKTSSHSACGKSVFIITS